MLTDTQPRIFLESRSNPSARAGGITIYKLRLDFDRGAPHRKHLRVRELVRFAREAAVAVSHNIVRNTRIKHGHSPLDIQD